MTENSASRSFVARLTGEPLIIFLLIGGSLFALYQLATSNNKPVISVSQDFIETLVAERELVLERALSDEEKNSIRNNFVDQEVLVREAMVRQLYLHDGQVRHRLADKMFYLLADDVGEPSADQLDAFYESRKHLYKTPEFVSFQHRYFAGDRPAAEKALASGHPEAVDGQRFYVGHDIFRHAPAELIAIFGMSFTHQLDDLEIGEWQGPIESSRGWHIVRMDKKEAQQDIPRSELENRLMIEWRGAQLAESRQRKLDALRENYRVVSTEATGSD